MHKADAAAVAQQHAAWLAVVDVAAQRRQLELLLLLNVAAGCALGLIIGEKVNHEAAQRCKVALGVRVAASGGWGMHACAL